MTLLAEVGFDVVALILGGLLMLGALLSGLAHRSFLSLTALFVLAGFVLGEGGFGVLELRARSEFVGDLAVVALVVILFRDGLEVEAEMLQKAWRLPLRKLVVAMPLTCAIVAAATHWLIGLGWTESFLVGALLSPTDPVLSSSVVTNPRVPRVVRHSLNLESGMNDGLALPAVLAFTAVLAGDDEFVWWRFVLQDVTLGFAFGIAMGLAAAALIPRHAKIPAHQRSLYALGVAFATYGVTVLPPEGNGLIAVFVCAITLGIRRDDLRQAFEERAQDLVEIVKLGVFVVFGSLLTLQRALRRRLGRGRRRRRHAADRAPRGDRDRADRDEAAVLPAGLHGLVRAQGRGHDGLLTAGPGRGLRERGAHLQPRRALRLRVDPGARALRHARLELGR